MAGALSPEVISGLFELGKAGISAAGNYYANKNQQKLRDANYEAIKAYLGQTDEKRKQTRDYMQGNYETGNEEFNQEANTVLPELAQQKTDIREANTEQQQEANKQMQAQLAQQGVRGGQASTLLGRQTGQLARESLRDENQLAYQEAQNRQNARLNYTGKKALIPYSSLNTQQWLYMPSAQEQAMMQNAINTKFGQ